MLMEKHLLVLTKRSLNALIVTTLVTLLGNVQQGDTYVKEKERLILSTPKKQGKQEKNQMGLLTMWDDDFKCIQKCLSHLIKDCDYYEKKMAKVAEVKKQRICNNGNMMAKPVWTNANRINHANQFIPRPVQLNTGARIITEEHENQANPHAGTSEVTNSAGTSHTIASQEKDEDVELIVVPSAIKITEEKVESRTSSKNSKKEESLGLLEEIALKQFRDSTENILPVTPSVNTCLPTEIEVSPTPTLRIHNIYKKSNYLVILNLPHGYEGHWYKGSTKIKRDEKGVVVRNKARIGGPRVHTGSEGLTMMRFCLLWQEYKLIRSNALLWDCIQGPRAWYATLSTFLENHRYKRGTIDKTLFIKRDKKDIMLVQVPDIMYAVCVCSVFWVTPKTSHLNVVKRIFKYLKGKSNLGLWYPKESPFDLEAFSDSDYGGSNLDRKSTTGIAWIYSCKVGVLRSRTVAQSQPSSSTLPVPSTSSPPVQSPPPIPTPTPTPIPASIPTPTPIPETEPEPIGHTFEEPSPAHQHFSPLQEQAQGQMTVDDLLQVVPQLMSRIDSLETDLKQTKLTMGSAIVKLVKKVKKLEGILKRRNVVLSDFEEEEPEGRGRKSQDDPLVSLVQGLVTPSKTTVNASGEEQVEDISPTTLEAAKTLSRVASQKPKSIDKGRRYKRRKESKGKKVATSLDFQEEVNTGSIKVSTVSEQVSTGSTKRSIPSPDKGQREGKSPMIIEEAPKKSKEQILQEEASLVELQG
ncbi:hypothetical protein Tco_0569919 [Tanacetum coccineum]